MAHSRKRANTEKPVTEKPVTHADETNKIGDEFDGLEFNNMDGKTITDMMQRNNELMALIKQFRERDAISKNLSKKIFDMKHGKVGFPLMVPIANQVFETIPENRKGEFLDGMEKSLGIYENQMRGIRGQIEHRGDDFKGVMLKTYKLIGKKLLGLGFDKDDLGVT